MLRRRLRTRVQVRAAARPAGGRSGAGAAAADRGGAVSGREVGAIAELIDHDAWEIAAAVRTGEVSAVEIAEQSLARLEADTLGAVWVVTRERAMAEAAAVDAALAAGRDPGPLAGVPVGWKDLIDTAGHPHHLRQRHLRRSRARARRRCGRAPHRRRRGVRGQAGNTRVRVEYHHPESALRRVPKPARSDPRAGRFQRRLRCRRCRRAWCRWHPAPTPAARSAARRPAAASSGSSRPSAESAWQGSTRCASHSTTAARWRDRCATVRSRWK